MRQSIARQAGSAAEVDAAWQRNRADLLEALARAGGTHDEGDVLAGILGGSLQLWAGERSAIVTELIAYPRLTALRLFLAGGDLEELAAMERELAGRAQRAGIGRLEIGGRAGWERALPGYRRLCVCLVKEI